jgi:hypothetical protein
VLECRFPYCGAVAMCYGKALDAGLQTQLCVEGVVSEWIRVERRHDWQLYLPVGSFS